MTARLIFTIGLALVVVGSLAILVTYAIDYCEERKHGHMNEDVNEDETEVDTNEVKADE